MQGLCLMDSHLVIYGQRSWAIFNMAGKRVGGKKAANNNGNNSINRPILLMRMETLEEFTVVFWSGEESQVCFTTKHVTNDN